MAFFNSAVKKAFDAYKKENGSDKKHPRISELNAEYAMLLERKKSSYAEYRKTKSEMCKIMYIASDMTCEIVVTNCESGQAEYYSEKEDGDRLM